jgi:glycolate oxidase FAD binding subunit
MSDPSMPLDAETSSHDLVPTTQEELRSMLAENYARMRRALAIVGGGTSLEYGSCLSMPAQTLATTDLRRIIDFPARDMTVTVEAGIRVEGLAEILNRERQRLPIDIAQSDRATLGGAIATDTNGPRRFGYGTLRDYVIGISAVTAAGREFHSGGRVVKNVAGYDLCKLLVGSLGTLAVITQVTLKLKPVPESSLVVWVTFDRFADLDAAVGDLMTSQTRPVAIEALNAAGAAAIETCAGVGVPANRPTLVVGFEGSARETSWQINTLKQEIAQRRPAAIQDLNQADSVRLWAALTGFSAERDEPTAFQANLLPSKTSRFMEIGTNQGASLMAHAANGIVIGKIPVGENPADRPEEALSFLRRSAHDCGGNLTVLRAAAADRAVIPVFDLPEASLSLMRGLRQAFDPAALLNPGRLIPI